MAISKEEKVAVAVLFVVALWLVYITFGQYFVN